MEFLSFLLCCLLFFLCFYFSHRTIKTIQDSKIIIVQDDRINTSSLLLKNYGIVRQIKDFSIVEVIFPDLNTEGNIVYDYSWYHVFKVSIPNFKHQRMPKFRVAKELSSYVIEHFELSIELTNLNNQYSEVNNLAKLISKSELYSSQIEIYNRALIEIEKLINKAQQLEKFYSSFIRDGLIGIKISNFDPDRIKNNSLIHQTKYKQLKEEYEYMKNTAKAYQDLRHQNNQ